MDRVAVDRTKESIDRFVESEMVISRGFMVSARKIFGERYKAAIRNLSHEYGKLIEYLPCDAGMTYMTSRKVLGWHKDAGKYDEAGEYITRFDSTED
ncbi:MAG: hypothetical protein U9Q68_01410 [Euryarchaeota archaeon]|nr:hypothetical protein [Euryarchaeota archaeon]